MRFTIAAILFAVFATPALADEVKIISPNIIYGVALDELGAAYTKRTGNTVVVVHSSRGKMLEEIATATPPADVIGLPTDMMDALVKAKGVAGKPTPLGRATLGLAVKKGAPKPDIGSVEKLAAALRGAQSVLVNDPKGGAVQATLTEAILKRPEFQGVHAVLPSKGDSTAALARGEGDMAIQLVQDILKEPEVDLVGPLPEALGGYIETTLVVSARSIQPKAAMDLIRFLTGPEGRAAWKAKGMAPPP